jgi:hypothetical protein
VTQLSKLATLGIARETTPNTYLVPTAGIPFLKGDVEDQITPLRDESWRGNDTLLQGVYPGVEHAAWDIDVLAYPDLLGFFFVGTIGPDTVTAGVSTTLSASTVVGATSISTAATIPVGTTIAIDTGTNIEYAVTGTPSGAGPYTIPLTAPTAGLAKSHTSGATVVGQTTHLFKQSPTTALPTFSLTLYDTTQYLGYAGLKFTDLGIKIDPMASVQINVKGLSFPQTVQTTVTETYTQYMPMLGWDWTQTQQGSTTTRGKTLDLAIKRAGEAVHSSDGTQGPREIFVAALESDGTYKAIFENQVDINTFLNYTQGAVVATVTQPLSAGGQSLAITMSKAAWTKGKRDLSTNYAQADFDINGVYNSTDGGAVQVTLLNFRTTAY